jgi:hypothetical protein
MTVAPSPTRTPYQIPPAPDVRKRALSQAIYSGDLLPSEAMRPNEFFVPIHHGLLRALIRARGLSASHVRYVLCVLEYSSGPHPHPGYALIRNVGGMRLPTIQNWCAWLGGMKPQQVYALRRELAAARVIHFVEGDPAKVALNPRWETWDAAVFQARPSRVGAGRPRRANESMKELPHDGGEQSPAMPEDDVLFGAPPAEIYGLVEEKSIDFSEEIHRFAPTNEKSAPPAALVTAPNTIENRKLRQSETPATAGVTPSVTAYLISSLSAAEMVEEARTETTSRYDEDAVLPIPPPCSARPPRLSLPERRNGETTRAYWLRVFGDHEPEGKRAQRTVVHAAARKVLGLALDKADLRLVGQLHQAAGSWGTVLHWVLKTGDVAAVDVRAYLHGFVRHAGANAEPAPGSSWLPETPAPADADGEEGEAPADAAAAEKAGEDNATRVRKLGRRLRAAGMWRSLDLDGLVPEAYHEALLALDTLRTQGAWPMSEFVPLLRILATSSVNTGVTRSDRWGCLLAELQRRVRQRQGEASIGPLMGPTQEVGTDTPADAMFIDPVLLGRRARGLRRVCGTGTDFGRALIAYVELDEREALERTAAILLRAKVPEEESAAVLAHAWKQVANQEASVATHTVAQRQCHWWTGVQRAAMACERQIPVRGGRSAFQ